MGTHKTLSACEKCFKKCQAQCCTFVPLPLKFIEENLDKVQREILSLHPFEVTGYYYPVVKIIKKEVDGKIVDGVNTDEQICPFLKSDKSCAVYDKRPYICKSFGTRTEKYHFLTCKVQQGFARDSGYNKDTLDYKLQEKATFEKYFLEMQEHVRKLIEDLK